MRTIVLDTHFNILKTIGFPKIEITRLQDFARMYSYRP